MGKAYRPLRDVAGPLIAVDVRPGVLSLASRTGWALAEIDSMPFEEFSEWLAAAAELFPRRS